MLVKRRWAILLFALISGLAAVGPASSQEACVRIRGSLGPFPPDSVPQYCETGLADTAFTVRSVHHLLRLDESKGGRAYEPLVINKLVNRSSVNLWRALKNNEALEVEIMLVDGSGQAVLNITLFGATVAAIEPISARYDIVAEDTADREKIQFDYTEIVINRAGEQVELQVQGGTS